MSGFRLCWRTHFISHSKAVLDFNNLQGQELILKWHTAVACTSASGRPHKPLPALRLQARTLCFWVSLLWKWRKVTEYPYIYSCSVFYLYICHIFSGTRTIFYLCIRHIFSSAATVFNLYIRHIFISARTVFYLYIRHTPASWVYEQKVSTKTLIKTRNPPCTDSSRHLLSFWGYWERGMHSELHAGHSWSDLMASQAIVLSELTGNAKATYRYFCLPLPHSNWDPELVSAFCQGFSENT